MATRRQDDGDGWAAVAILIATAFGVGGLAYGADQQQKREQEAARFRHELGLWRAALAQKEAEFANLAGRLGPRNEQVRLLAAEVERLRAEVAQRQRAA